jgi:hypothetical protein
MEAARLKRFRTKDTRNNLGWVCYQFCLFKILRSQGISFAKEESPESWGSYRPPIYLVIGWKGSSGEQLPLHPQTRSTDEMGL